MFGKQDYRGAWAAQSVGASDFGSSHDLTASEFEPASGSGLTAQSLEPASDSVSLSLSLPLPCSCSVSLSFSKINNKPLKTVYKKKLKIKMNKTGL